MKLITQKQENQKIMIVDDDVMILETISLLLKEECFQVEQCSSGYEAIEKFNNSVHAVVLDIHMPDMSGLEVFQQIKSKNQYIPIIFYTGADKRQEERRDIRRHFRPHAYVRKGDPGQLMDTVFSAVESYENILRSISLSETLYKELEKNTNKIKANIEGTIHAMALTVEMRDPYTAGHQRRVAHLAGAIAEKMNLSKEQIEGVQLAGTVHDIGKMQIPIEVLSKSDKLTELELDMIKSHPQAGFDILKTIEFQCPVAEYVLQHHERMDGSGYPFGLSSNNITIEAKILSVADVVDAIGPHRPYRKALGIEVALQEISNNKGVLYDPDVVGACLDVVAKNHFQL